MPQYDQGNSLTVNFLMISVMAFTFIAKHGKYSKMYFTTHNIKFKFNPTKLNNTEEINPDK
jgi:hypothetical protein